MGKLVSFDPLKHFSAVIAKWDGQVLQEKPSIKMLGFSLNSKLDWISYIVCIATSASKKIGAFFNSMKFHEIRSTTWSCILLSCLGWSS